MIWIDERNKIINVPEDTSLDELANFLVEVFPFEEHDFKIVVHASDEDTDFEGKVYVPA